MTINSQTSKGDLLTCANDSIPAEIVAAYFKVPGAPAHIAKKAGNPADAF